MDITTYLKLYSHIVSSEFLVPSEYSSWQVVLLSLAPEITHEHTLLRLLDKKQLVQRNLMLSAIWHPSHMVGKMVTVQWMPVELFGKPKVLVISIHPSLYLPLIQLYSA